MSESEDLPNPWHVVTSKKPRQIGCAFLMRDEEFVLKVYKNETFEAKPYAEYLARQMNRLERIWQAKEATP